MAKITDIPARGSRTGDTRDGKRGIKAGETREQYTVRHTYSLK